MSAIQIRGLHFAIGSKEILQNIDLDIHSGEFFFLLGPSGSGKTTLLRVLAGFNRPTQGQLLLDERPLTDLPARQRNFGMVFQSYALFPHLSVKDNVAYGLKVRKLSGDDIKLQVGEALERVGLSGYETRMPGSLSGGEQQRVALARALVIKPDLLLLDEPLSNLDAQLRQKMRKELRDIQKNSGVTAVYVTHDQDEALSMADRMAVLSEGKLLQMGTPRDIYYHPSDSFVAKFIGKANLFRVTIREIMPDNRMRLETPFGNMKVNGPLYPNHTELTACIRPEALRWMDGNTASPESNQISAIVTDVRFYGESLEVELDAAPGHILHALIANPGHRSVSVGDTVRWQVDPDQIILLEK